MRIAIISNLFPPHVIGGYELGCLNLARAARDAGIQVRVLTSTPTGRLNKREKVVNLDVQTVFAPIYNYETLLSSVPVSFDPASFGGIEPANVVALKNELRNFRPDAIWIFNPLGLGPVGIVETAVQSRIPTTLHLMDHLDGTVADHQIGFNVLPRWIRAKSKMGAIACSEKTLQRNEIHGLFADSKVIANGVRMGAGCQPPREAVGASTCNLVYFGQVERHKGILQLIHALAKTRKKIAAQDIKLHIAGGGSVEFARELNQTIAELNLHSVVVQHGFCEPEKLKELLDSMHLAVFPLSPDEPFAYVVIEAIQAGLPIIVSRQAGCAEFLPRDYPYLLNHRDDVDELASLLSAAIENREQAVQWCDPLQAAVSEHCDLDRKCLPRCIEFLMKPRCGGDSGCADIIQFDAPERFETSVHDGLSSWYGIRHLNNMYPDSAGQTSDKISVGRSLERWIRRRITKPVKQAFLRESTHRVPLKKAA